MRKQATVTISKRWFNREGVVVEEVERHYDLRLVYAFLAGSLFGSIMAAVSLVLQGVVVI